jgi:hypothetical protein
MCLCCPVAAACELITANKHCLNLLLLVRPVSQVCI